MASKQSDEIHPHDFCIYSVPVLTVYYKEIERFLFTKIPFII